MTDRTQEPAAGLMPLPPKDFSAGFACFVGRPNVGKSTLLNALVGDKVAITSSKPQTTRHTIRGVVTDETTQLVVVDTPGLHRPRNLLGERLNELVLTTLAEVDVIGMCLPADEKIGPGDRFIAQQLAGVPKTPKIGIVTKADKVDRQRLAEALLAASRLMDFDEVVPVSAAEGENVDVLRRVLAARLPASPPLYPDGEITDEPERTMIAEIVREASLEDMRDELPHSIAVVVEEIIQREGRDPGHELADVHVNIFVERSSQKSIIIGRGGANLKKIGSRARGQIERILGTKIFLDLHVKIAKDWQRDPKELGKLGF